MVTDPAAKALIALIQTQCDVARLTAGPPGIPPDRLDALRTAFRKAMEDKELLAKTEKLGLPIQPAYGDTVLAMVREALAQSPETIALLAESLKKK
jgi:tripartite-type tricarboxylate transporter receptor subunit TctC